ncbi:MAG: HAD-IC family P-type ATPase, partial [Methylococcales bacterium]|nr:HAD-IC family P-type ATPase [Methylococcales bacterium]
MRENQPTRLMTQKPLTPWYAVSPADALQALQVASEQGLDAAEVLRRRENVGVNTLTPRAGKSPLLLFLAQFNQSLVYILLVAGTVTAFLQEWVDSGVIFGVVLLNAIIGFIQERHALQAIAALASVLNSSVLVLRNGQKRTLDATELVPGDIVFLQSGDKVPADLRLLTVRELQIDESALTGESVPVQKNTATVAMDTLLADRVTMAYSSTLVTYGAAMGLVVETGDRTEIGCINKLIAAVTDLDTPLTLKIAQFSQWLLWIIIVFAVATFCVGWWRGESALDMFMASVALAVGAIPEGLPAALTITLSIGVSRMAKRNAIIRKLPAVETLGSTTVICSDKTGTLTQNQMTVQCIIAGDEQFEVSGSGYIPTGAFSLNQQPVVVTQHHALMECLKAGLLCNDARLLENAGEWCIEGDPTEGALLVAAHKATLYPPQVNGHHPRLDTLPFEAQHQFMATLHHNHALDVHQIYLKGSVESILPRCVNAFDAQLSLSTLNVSAIQQQVEALARQGLRVLAFARGDHGLNDTTVEHEEVRGGLTFIGLQAMIDPARPEAMAAVAACQAAGIRVKMITGDHPGTARAIAIKLGLLRAGRLHRLFAIPVQGRVISGSDLAQLSVEDMIPLVDDCDVFARITPEQKLRLVQALQAKGHVVAMTGDGVNDAPALRQANIGVAMGKGGTEVAKEAAAMVLTDDNFATIEAAVEEGRAVFDNLIKFIAWTLPTNLGEGLMIAVAVFAGVALPITPVQILWINMSTAVLLGLMLSFEAKEPGLMQQKPRSPAQPILTRRLTLRIFLVGLLLLTGSFGLFEWELSHGEPLSAARTVAVNVFV